MSDSPQTRRDRGRTASGDSGMEAEPAPGRAMRCSCRRRALGLVDVLLARSFVDLTMLDIAAPTLAWTRPGATSERVRWIPADVARWWPARDHDLWHDQVGFHFLAGADGRAAYPARLTAAMAGRAMPSHRHFRPRWSRAVQRPVGRLRRRLARWRDHPSTT